MHKSTAKVGQIIRAYDFKPMVGRGDCFLEGKVVEVGLTKAGFDGYTIEVTRTVFDDKSKKVPAGEFGYIPFEVSFMEYAGRIMNLSA